MLIWSCGEDDNNNNDGDAGEIESLANDAIYPSDNEFSEAKQELGRMLFWDPILSGNKDVACVTCHHPDHAYADGIERSRGVGASGLANSRSGGVLIDRNSPTILNAGFNGFESDEPYDPAQAPMFWDSRESGLEAQAIQPILSAEEMRGTEISEEAILDTVIARLESIPEYRERFEAAFGSSGISEVTIAAAIATFERGIFSNNSRFDQYMLGNTDALTTLEIEGMESFLDAGCANCHGGTMFSDFELKVLGVPNNGVDDRGATGIYDFRTPTLRNVELTAPYMHNGEFDSLEDVVDFYRDISRGGGGNNAINNNLNIGDIDDDARDLDLNQGDINEIVAFLESLTDENFDRTIPASVPSNLPVGGNLN